MARITRRSEMTVRSDCPSHAVGRGVCAGGRKRVLGSREQSAKRDLARRTRLDAALDMCILSLEAMRFYGMCRTSSTIADAREPVTQVMTTPLTDFKVGTA